MIIPPIVINIPTKVLIVICSPAKMTPIIAPKNGDVNAIGITFPNGLINSNNYCCSYIP